VAAGRILVVDDDPKIRRIIGHDLAEAGYEVRETGEPGDVLRLASESAPDLVVLDIMMPGKDGLEVARELRAHGPTARVPFMFITAKEGAAVDEAVTKAYDLGAVGYVEKPFRKETLLEVVRRLLAGVRT
jgi:CheY-like chemotaxis protein